MKKFLMLICTAATLAAVYLAKADNDYQYIISGYPVANPCSSLASEGLPLATGRYTYRSSESPLEARFRTFVASAGSKLLSTKVIGLHIIIR